MVKNIDWVSIQTLADRLFRHPLMQDLNLETIIYYSIDFIHLMGLPKMYMTKQVDLDIENFRAKLPDGLVSINQVRNNHNDLSMRHSTNTYEPDETNDQVDSTYFTQGNILYTSFKTGHVTLNYESIPIDEMGYPMLPDNNVFMMALELFIKKQWFTILFDMGKIQQAVLSNVQQEYSWRVGQCNSEFTIPSVSEMESISGMWCQIIPRHNEFKKGFKTLGTKEILKF